MISPEPPRVGVVIVNYRRVDLTESALASIRASEGVRVRIVLVDNASDGVWARAQAARDDLTALINVENVGFGAACNQGIEMALAEGAQFVFLLNNDACVERDTLARLAEAAARGDGLAAPKILLPDGRLYAAGGIVEPFRARCRNRGLYETDCGQYDEPERMVFASACALMISREALDEGVRFWEPYFLYYEDAEFCLRMARTGRRVAYTPAARVTHLESVSTGEAGTHRREYYNARNRLVWLRRNGRLRERFVGGPVGVVAVLVCSARWLARGRPRVAVACLCGLIDGLLGRGFS